MATLARVLQSCALAVALVGALGAPQALKAATESEASTYGVAVEVAAKEAQRRDVHRAAALVCWGSAAERRLVLALSAVGVAVSLLRGRDQTTAAAVDSLLREGSGRTAILVDMACPAASRLLLLASKLRLFDLANSWLLFENGRLEPYASEDSTVNHTMSWDPGVDDFPDVELVTAGRYGAQRREEALLPDEEVLLEVWPPLRRASDRPWISSQVSLVSPAALRALDGLVVLSDSDVLWVQARGARASGTAVNDSPADGDDACPRQLQGFIMFRSSLAREIQVRKKPPALANWKAYLAAAGCADAAGGAEWRWTMSPEEEKAVQGRRGDLQNATLRSPIIVRIVEFK